MHELHVRVCMCVRVCAQVRIGVVSHTLLQLSLKNKRMMQASAAALSDDEQDDV